MYRFLKGVKDKGVRQIIAAGQEDLGKVTVVQLNQKINNLLQAGEESESDREPDISAEESWSGSEDEGYRKRNKRNGTKKGDGKELKRALKAIGELEEKVKQMMNGQQIETFAIQANSDSARGRPPPQLAGELYQNYNRGQAFARGTGPGLGRQFGEPPTGYTCYHCGNTGHLYRFCPEPCFQHANSRRNQYPQAHMQNQKDKPIIFPVERGVQTMVWVDSPPNGLAAGYYPMATEPAARCPEQIGDSSGNGEVRRQAQNATPIRDSGRVTELNNTAAVDLVSSAARGLMIGQEVVRYVNAVEESCAVGARCRAEADEGSSEAPARARIRVAGPGPRAADPGPSNSPETEETIRL